jgi:hypothetical protein
MAKVKEPKEPATSTESAPVSAAEQKPSIPRKSEKVPKLEKKNKSRLPRKEKKAQMKAANRKSAGKA